MDIKERAREILRVQQLAVNSLGATPAMLRAIEALAGTRARGGKVVTAGMGKAGIIATKMSATLASIGIPSFFLSPAEAAHGDVGRVSPVDLIVVFSHSGSTGEVVAMVETLHALNGKQNGVILVGGANKPKIPADIIVSYGDVQESCVVSKVPSTSTTLMLVIADVLAITAAESLGLDDSWFKARHPGGAIGQAYKVDKK